MHGFDERGRWLTVDGELNRRPIGVELRIGGAVQIAAPLVGREVVARILKEHLAGTRNTLSDLSALMNLELINKCLFLMGKEARFHVN